MKSFITRWQNTLFWAGAGLLMIAATVIYQPAAAKTGSLLVWTNNHIYTMDIDSLILQRVGPALAGEAMIASPGCLGQTEISCWVTADQVLYEVGPGIDSTTTARNLPIGDGFQWATSAMSWSPSGAHLAYHVVNEATRLSELRVYNAITSQVDLIIPDVDPDIAVAWTLGCQTSLTAVDCQLGFNSRVDINADDRTPKFLVAVAPATQSQQIWEIPPGPIYEVQWTPDNQLLYSNPQRHFRDVTTHMRFAPLPNNGELGNTSPTSRHTVYYQPFTLSDCEAGEDACLHLGTWLTSWGQTEEERRPNLIYNINLAEPTAQGLNFIPIWAPKGNAFVFFQEGRLIYYDLVKRNAAIWYNPVVGKLRSMPIFSPNEEAVAFVDNQGQGVSEYRLVVVNPRLQPVEHVIETETGLQLLAWLPY
ncbi:MAG: hypothetical protein AAF485_22930 [Chloroflexota bacterium]